MDNMKEYQIGMSWDSCEGSLYRETHTTWITAFNEQDAISQATSEYSHNKGFRIEYAN